MAAETLERLEFQQPEPLDPRYNEFDPILRPFAVEVGYERWGDVFGLISSTLGDKVFEQQHRGNLSHDEESEVSGQVFEVIRSACELGYFSRRVNPTVEVNREFGEQLAHTILGEDYQDLTDRLDETVTLLEDNSQRPFLRRIEPEAIREWEQLVQRMVPAIQTPEQFLLTFKNERYSDGRSWQQLRAERRIALRQLQSFLPVVAKQAYLWGRTDSLHFFRNSKDAATTVTHHDGLVTTDTDREDFQIRAAMEDFEDTANLPTYSFLGRIGLWREDRAYVREHRHIGIRSKRSDAKWVRECWFGMSAYSAEYTRLRQEFRSHPLEIS